MQTEVSVGVWVHLQGCEMVSYAIALTKGENKATANYSLNIRTNYQKLTYTK